MDVAPGSAAEVSGLRVGDVINSANGKPIRAASELADEVSGRSGEDIRLGYLIRGMWQSETMVGLRAK